MRLARPAAVLLALGALLFAAAPAPAGGPTSVLLVSPSTGRTASLHTTNSAYTTLMSQLGSEPVAARPDVAPPGIGGDQIVVTWMIHDVQPWRIDRITFDDDGRPEWIHTSQSMGGGPIEWDGDGIWHRPADVDVLDELLTDLGMMGRTRQRPAEEDPDGAAVDAAGAGGSGAEAPPGGAAGAGGSADGALDAATWALPAVAGGILVGVLGDRWLRRRRGADGDRWQLVDAPGPSA
ncbi:hypothetical protein [Jiangella alba]|uniref:MYXO-CTERM domain-containing protein n=1 Tax=Jiangella alba TaxID=561176 RepID=A0A1H5PX14_9ACTN|nr:hypothetical protein [Jiangella alba]SEF18275.1 hypothetical protein SAMN04488561_6329 [Jiangella alba]